MIRVNRQTDYAIRVVLSLARHEGEARLSTADVQNEMQIPRALLARIVAQLAHAGIITTFPGRDGGIALARPREEITLCHVIESVEGPIQVSECLRDENDCPNDKPCPTRACWARIQRLVRKELEGMNFADLAAYPEGILQASILEQTTAR